VDHDAEVVTLTEVSTLDAEQRLWQLLRAHRFAGYKFRRQAPIGRYVVDFVGFSERLIIEIDGPSHDFTVDADAKRARWLQSQGYRVINFTADEVLLHPEVIWRTVAAVLGGVNPSELMR